MIRVAIVADIRLYREGLAQILERHPNISVVAMVGSTNRSLTVVPDLAPDLVLIDMAITERIAAIRRVVARVPGAKVVTLDTGEDDHDVVPSADAGVIASAPREGSVEDLIAVIECAAREEAARPARIAGTLRRRVAGLATDRGLEPDPGRGAADERRA